MSVKTHFNSANTYWERFQALHALLQQSGSAQDTIILHPDSHEALTIEMAPRERGKVFDPPPIVAAVTIAGPIKISSDPDGVRL